MSIEALVSLRGPDSPNIGRDRIRLLEAVARAGSITGGAKAVGLTYKAAWDALDAMANLFGQPLLATRAGGKAGGGAMLTDTGLRVIDAFHRLEAEMARIVRTLEPDLAGTGVTPFNLVSGLLMKTSARNALRGTITRIETGPLSAEVTIEVSRQTSIVAIVTATSLRDLGLVLGRETIVLVKASFIEIAPGAASDAAPGCNVIAGTIARCEVSGESAEVSLDIGDGKTLTASLTAKDVADLRLDAGVTACAHFAASHVILAID